MQLEGNTFSVQSLVSEAARFDTVKNKWEKITDVQEARFNACGVAANEKIFIAGGVGKVRKDSELLADLKTCEVYNMLTDEWQFVACLTVPREEGNMVLINETLYVLGGYRLGDCIPTVECYDDEKDQWNEKTVIPPHVLWELEYLYPQFTFKGSSLNIFKGSLNNLKVVGPVTSKYKTKLYWPFHSFRKSGHMKKWLRPGTSRSDITHSK